MSLILRCFLGLRQEKTLLILDPVIPPSLDGLTIDWEMAGHCFEVEYRITGSGYGPIAVSLNGAALPFSRGDNPYRVGAAEIPMAEVHGKLTNGLNRLTIQLG